ncbi:MAG TPA: M20/M25/M40 family metallo-hydrolase [Gemmatimonadales bacterium]|nr:M20/M25/M40 family metallo-hydrolase [Gemmatimonadales bacterium]
MTPRRLLPTLLAPCALLTLAALPLPLRAQAAPKRTPAAPTAQAAKLVQAADSDVVRGHLTFLADDLLEGRAPGTRGGELAAKYIAAQFIRLGLVPAGDSGTYYHRVPIVSLTPAPTLALGGRPLAFKKDFVLWSMRDEPEVRTAGELVFVGFGIVAPEYRWNDYAGTDVKGKTVVVLVNDPGFVDSTLFKGRTLTYYGRWTYKLEEAARQGAAAVLLVHTTETASYGWGTVVGSWTGPQVRVERPATSLVAAGWLTDSVATRLLSPVAPTLAGVMRKAVTRGFRAVPLATPATLAVTSTLRRSSTANVIARWPGRGAHADEAVLLGAHYDHLGISQPVDGDSIYNGAVDNASGTAAMLAAAEAFVRSGVRPGRSILFTAFGAEESGLLGSTALAARFPLPLARLAAVLNLDEMNLFGRTRDISALGLDQSTLGTVFERAAQAEGLRITVDREALANGSFFRSDHFPFARAGVPALSLGTGTDFVGRPAGWGKQQIDEYGEKRYHQPGDELLPWYSYGGAMQQLRTVLRTAVAVADAPTQPTWLQGSEFREAGEQRVAGK